ncbi:MAG: hypothetical protein B7X50_14265 [Alishewanella sp. 34-51-39]|nr:MAG: hypothetical protein B7X50_14265 [Alishewanella sp. 34-51-39]
MLKLSRRNWNNVLIFVVLLLMFSLYDWRGTGQAPTTSSLLPEQSQLLSIAVGEVRLVQAAGQWQLQPRNNGSVSAQQMLNAWLYTPLQPAVGATKPTEAPVAQASVQLAGEFAPTIWLLYPAQQDYLLQQVGQPQLYLLPAAQARLLFLID